MRRSSIVTQATGNEAELARAENQLRAIFPRHSRSEFRGGSRAMRKKIADLKNPLSAPPEAEMRKELDRLQKENTALLQLKELEIENLKLKGMPACRTSLRRS